MLLLTATPHDGNNQAFFNRLRLLDPSILNDESQDLSHLLVRNMKEDVITLEGKDVFSKRTSTTIEIKDTNHEEMTLHNSLDDYLIRLYNEARIQGKGKGIKLITTIIRKRASSSIYALRKTLSRMNDPNPSNENIEDISSLYEQSIEENDEEQKERFENKLISFIPSEIDHTTQDLTNLIAMAKRLEDKDSKLAELLQWIKRIKESDVKAKILIFTEYKDTLSKLRNHLVNEGYQVEKIDGSMSQEERELALASFRDNADIMVATDAAGEGLDMQFANIEINFDIPWNPNRLEQRMGRIHRIGQHRNVYYYNMILPRTIDGQILSRVLDKIEEIRGIIGGRDKVYDIIGQIITEDDISQIYEELLEIPKSEWIPRITRKIDYVIEERRKTLQRIDLLLSKQKLDRSMMIDYKQFNEVAVTIHEVKRFVEAFINKYKGSISLLDKHQEVYSIHLPQILKADIKRLDREMILVGTYYQSKYEYLALGNKTVMCMLNKVAKPTCSVIAHPSLHGVLLIFKVEAKDGKHRPRKAQIVPIVFDGEKTKIIDLKDIWKFDLLNNLDQEIKMDTFFTRKHYEYIDNTIEVIENNLKKNTKQSLHWLTGKIKQTITNYFSYKIEKLDNQIKEYEFKQNESPYSSYALQSKKQEQKVLANEYRSAIKKIETEMQIKTSRELIGIALIIPQNTIPSGDVGEHTERREFIFNPSEFTKQNLLISTENSNTTFKRMTENPQQWIEYHKDVEATIKSLGIDPCEEIIKRLRHFPDYYRIGDFGCGKAKIMDVFGERVFGCDYVAVNSKVVACDMVSTGILDRSLDIIVFSLSLMNKNWPDHIREARRCLVTNGTLLIAITTKSLTERLSNLKDLLKAQGFDIYDEQIRSPFTFIEATKRETSLIL